MATALMAVAWTVPMTALADPGQAGRVAGGLGAQGFDPNASYRTATQALGLQDARTSGELGGEVGIQVTQQQQRTFRCRDGARITAGGVRVAIDACEQGQDGSLTSLRVSVCDALTQGIGCTDERYTAVKHIPPGGETTFTGGLLTGTYRVSADCNSNECEMTMHQLHGDTWGGHDMRNLASQRVDATDGHPINAIRDVRKDPVFGAGENFANNRAHCLGGQFDQLFTEGDIPVSCNPDDPRSIDFLDIAGKGQCEPDILETDLCIVNIPTQIVTCEPDSRQCEVHRKTEEFICELRREVHVAGGYGCTPQTIDHNLVGTLSSTVHVICNDNGTITFSFDHNAQTPIIANSNPDTFLNGLLFEYSRTPNVNITTDQFYIECESDGECMFRSRYRMTSCDGPAWHCSNINNWIVWGWMAWQETNIIMGSGVTIEDYWVDTCDTYENRVPQHDAED